MRRVAVVQEYIPLYRRPFFELLDGFLALHDIQLQVLAGEASGQQAHRKDSWTSTLISPLKQREVSVLGRRVVVSDSLALARGADLIIFEQARRNVALYQALFNPFFRTPTALWGHGVDFAFRKSSFERRLLQVLTRRAAWFFGYTADSVTRVVEAGFPHNRTTCVVNSIDTARLRDEVAAAGLRCAKDGRKGLVFVGGLDDTKRIEFLLESLTAVLQAIPNIRIDFIGDGVKKSLVQSFAEGLEQVTIWGVLVDDRKAEVLAQADAIVMPGRVGLVALDSFACGLPILTTEHHLHAPEFAYLTDNVNCRVSKNSVAEYANCIIDTISSESLLVELKQNCLSACDEYSIEKMVQNFGGGILDALGSITTR